MPSSVRRTFAVVLLLASSSSALVAQRLRGEVVLPDSVSPAAGVIVIVSDAAGADVAKTTSGENGTFDLPLPHAGPFRVRVLRLGFRPTLAGSVELVAGQTGTMHLVLTASIVSLAQVQVKGQTVCGVREDSGQIVADLWEQARFALLATQTPEGGMPIETTALTYERRLDTLGTALRPESTKVVRAATSQFFASVPADSLARVGYVSEDKTGVVYRAPDAAVLLSQSFVALHCFTAVPPPEAHPEWVGLAVRPAKSREKISDIDGTLWLDRASAELRLFEYKYTGIPAEGAKAGAGGRVEFTRLPTGQWIVNRWEIRMPRYVLVRSMEGIGTWRQVVTRMVVQEIRVQGGEVLDVGRDAAALYQSKDIALDAPPVLKSLPLLSAQREFDLALPSALDASRPVASNDEVIVRGRVTQLGDSTIAVSNADVEILGTPLKAVTNSEGRFHFTGLPVGTYEMRVRRFGYVSLTKHISLDAQHPVEENVALRRLQATLSTVVIEGRQTKVPAGFEDVYARAAHENGTFFTAEDIDKLNPLDVGSLLSLVPLAHVSQTKVAFQRCNPAQFAGPLAMMGVKTLPKIQVYIDGARVTQIDGWNGSGGADGAIWEELKLVSPRDIQAMEVYNGVTRIPAEFVNDACGVIAIWTKK